MNQEKLQKIFALTKNSFYNNFKFFPISDYNQIFKCILEFKINTNESLKYLFGAKNINISLIILEDFIQKLENLYMIIIIFNMKQNLMLKRTEINTFLVISHDINSDFIWVLGMANNTKDFRVFAAKRRDIIHLKEFIIRYIPSENRIITNG